MALPQLSLLLGTSGGSQLRKSSWATQKQAGLGGETGLWLQGCGGNPTAGA